MKKPKISCLSCDSTPRSSPGISPSHNTGKRQLLTKSRISNIQSGKNSLLSRLANRSKLAVDSSISAETAASVVKNYILPMFELDYRQKQEHKRQAYHSRRFSTESSTVYSELKLSEKLLKENQELKETVNLMQRSMKENSQFFEIIKSENEELKKSIEEKLINSEFYLFENQKLRVEVNRMTFALTYAASQYRKYKNLFERTTQVSFTSYMSKMISDKIHEFSLTYSKTLKHQVLQLEHSAHLIFLEKEIVVDKSKGLYEALNKLFTPFCIDSKLNEEFKIVKDQSARLFSLIENERKGMKQILHEREKFMNGYLQLSDLEIEYYTQKERIVRIFKERTSSMQQEISKISEEKQTISNKFTELEKKYQTCLDEFKEFRKRVRRKFVIYDKNQEKFCKNCQRSYTEHENFNWSCRTHASYYSQGFFWCCGETLKDTPGCIVSKHISNEDSEEIYGEERTANKIFCTACKSWGHGIQSCHKDPNFRSAFDINDEYQRITKIIKNQSNFNECLPRVLESDSDSESLEFTEIAKLKSECLCGQSGPCRTCKSLKAQTSLADKEPLPPTT